MNQKKLKLRLLAKIPTRYRTGEKWVKFGRTKHKRYVDIVEINCK